MDINSYGNAIGSVTPGTFVPDVSPGPKSTPLDATDQATAAAGSGSFRDAVKSFLSDVNTKMATSDQMSQDYAVGKTGDMAAVVKSVEEANLSMQFTLAIRNKLLDAYTEINRMQF